MRAAAVSAITAAAAALALPATAQAAPERSSSPSAAAGWQLHSGPYDSLSWCQEMGEYYGYNSRNSYCDQLHLEGGT
ncbi:hypothetical protein [Streptomyces sp. NPDC018031]|uniref:hypothetical protein n=1 Tax=Streptomyces sp. NPDC018031 TaxID=3365033 RepID=UPI00379BAF21